MEEKNPADDFKIGQLTKELVAIRLKKMADPCAAAASLVKQTLIVAIKGITPGGAGQAKVVEDACRGGITGLLLAEQNMGRGAVLILEAVCELSSEMDLDPTAMMQSALRGIADMHRFLRPDQLSGIEREIELHFLGVAEVFAACVQDNIRSRAAAKPANPAKS